MKHCLSGLIYYIKHKEMVKDREDEAVNATKFMVSYFLLFDLAL